MITDALLQLSSAQVVTASAVSTNTIDLSVNRDVGSGEKLYAVITVDEAAVSAGATTVDFQIISSAAANLSSPTVLAAITGVPKADLTLGRRPICLEIPASVLNAQLLGQRYLGVNYNVNTANLSAGKFTCCITNAPVDGGKYYPSGFTVF